MLTLKLQAGGLHLMEYFVTLTKIKSVITIISGHTGKWQENVQPSQL